MSYQDEIFSSAHVDEQIERQEFMDGPSARLVQDLQQRAQGRKVQDEQTLEHAWERIDARRKQAIPTTAGGRASEDNLRQLSARGHSRAIDFSARRRSSLFTLSFVAVLVIGSMLGLFGALRQHNSQLGSQPVVLSTPAGLYMSDITAQSGVMRRLNASNGKEIWEYHPPATSQILMVAAGAHMTYGVAINKIYAVNAQTGKLVWSHAFQEDIINGHSWNQPLVIGDVLYVTTSTSVYAFDAQNGQLQRTYLHIPIALTTKSPPSAKGMTSTVEILRNGHIIFSKTPISANVAINDRNAGLLSSIKDKTLYVTSLNTILAFDLATGEKLWQQKISPAYALMVPHVENGILYASAVNKDAGIDKITATSKLYAFSLATHQLLWQSLGIASGRGLLFDITVTPTIIYGGVTGGDLYAFSASNGEILWKSNLVGGYVDAAPQLDNQKLYFVTVALYPHSVAQNAQDGNGIAALNTSNGASAWLYALPVVDAVVEKNGIVYASSGAGSTIAFNATTRAVLWKAKFGAGCAAMVVIS